MQIQILLNPRHDEAAAIQADLAAELNALQKSGVTITATTSPPPPGTLGAAEVYQFLVAYHGDVLTAAVLLKALLEVIHAVLRRRGVPPITRPKRKKAARSKAEAKTKKPKKAPAPEPLVIIIAGDAVLHIPSTTSSQTSFIKKAGERDKARPATEKKR